MEYLMTYGWAILIIAVVLGALFQLGVFNTTNLAPRAQPRFLQSSQAQPGSVNLVGVCSGEAAAVCRQFDGQCSNVPRSLLPSSLQSTI